MKILYIPLPKFIRNAFNREKDIGDTPESDRTVETSLQQENNHVNEEASSLLETDSTEKRK